MGAASAVWSGGASLPAGLQAALNAAATASLNQGGHSVGLAFSAADSAFDFLAAGQTLTASYNVTVTDSQGSASTKPVVFTVTGTNDAPVLAADTGSHAMTEIAGATAGTGTGNRLGGARLHRSRPQRQPHHDLGPGLEQLERRDHPGSHGHGPGQRPVAGEGGQRRRGGPAR